MFTIKPYSENYIYKTADDPARPEGELIAEPEPEAEAEPEAEPEAEAEAEPEGVDDPLAGWVEPPEHATLLVPHIGGLLGESLKYVSDPGPDGPPEVLNIDELRERSRDPSLEGKPDFRGSVPSAGVLPEGWNDSSFGRHRNLYHRVLNVNGKDQIVWATFKGDPEKHSVAAKIYFPRSDSVHYGQPHLITRVGHKHKPLSETGANSNWKALRYEGISMAWSLAHMHEESRQYALLSGGEGRGGEAGGSDRFEVAWNTFGDDPKTTDSSIALVDGDDPNVTTTPHGKPPGPSEVVEDKPDTLNVAGEGAGEEGAGEVAGEVAGEPAKAEIEPPSEKWQGYIDKSSKNWFGKDKKMPTKVYETWAQWASSWGKTSSYEDWQAWYAEQHALPPDPKSPQKRWRHGKSIQEILKHNKGKKPKGKLRFMRTREAISEMQNPPKGKQVGEQVSDAEDYLQSNVWDKRKWASIVPDIISLANHLDSNGNRDEARFLDGLLARLI